LLEERRNSVYTISLKKKLGMIFITINILFLNF